MVIERFNRIKILSFYSSNSHFPYNRGKSLRQFLEIRNYRNYRIIEIRNYRNKFILITKRFGILLILSSQILFQEKIYNVVVKCWSRGNLIMRFGIGESIYIVCRYAILCSP